MNRHGFGEYLSRGVLYSRHLRGVSLSLADTASIASTGRAAISTSSGKNRLKRQLRFSTPPFCQGDLGSQK